MKILLIEDKADEQFRTERELRDLGHTVIAAGSGTEGLELYRCERPDVVITGIYTTGLDGFALTRAIQALAAPRWQPVLFLSDHADDELEVRALQVGADTYVVKPVSPEVLGARLEVLQRTLRMQQLAEGRAQQLERYYRAEEDEKRIAGHLMQRVLRGTQLEDPAVRHWISAATVFSGDIVAAQRTPSGALHVLLADGTGHGLAASINVLPVLAPFYRMSEKGYGVDAIARELNAKVKNFLPGDRFVAATLAVIDMRERVIGVWNGGNPEPVLIGPHGSRAFTLRHVPLGVLPDEEFDDTLDAHGFVDGSQFFVYSDGLVEAENAAGETFGDERLAGVLVNAEAADRFDALKTAVTGHVGGAAAHDDISILMVECRWPGEAPPAAVGRVLPGGLSQHANWRSSLRLTAAEIRQVDAVPLLLSLAGQFEPVRRGSDRLFVILSELYNNALDHGLLRLDSRLKLHPEGMEAYLGERQERLAGLDHGEIELELEQLGGRDGAWLRVSCRDSGPGFDHAAFDLGATRDSEMPFGRGLLLLRAICADLRFNVEGNHVTATLALGQSGSQ
ncbi:ATP-binding SpoIIE family protein phosphatase [Sulfurisoma sediminicola]|uniref:Serine phosphatase RsbU (Regulator of sigma subunit) n=1 Tax=Sulfurisoma sediminicola TaxID=1381557 RepID=A0A497XJS9_9PROT|nr:fused response regulator/phosphatase [Sulfurisoma sediminicola]RLJ67516.1 serine phosphatase RsbU (regulator of sigma subunit) [Sulfurisoma sediminicola]